jgi:hypothetical protein
MKIDSLIAIVKYHLTQDGVVPLKWLPSSDGAEHDGEFVPDTDRPLLVPLRQDMPDKIVVFAFFATTHDLLLRVRPSYLIILFDSDAS